MPSEELNPMQEVFKMDQDAAAAQEVERDQQSWELNIRNGQAQAIVHEQMAAQESAKAELYRSLSGLVFAAALSGLLLALVFAASLIVGMFR